ncbi:MAG: hypothetical protein DRH04_07930 [Deltaproteobacteria bacterium]|nr:MAG: hypothetical protein DRH04_07930 [Deltaproteobacteria bacterium]
MVFRDFTWTQIACDAGDLGIRYLRNMYGEVVSHEEGSIPTFEPTTSKDDARDMGVSAIHDMAVKSANVPHITFQKVHVIPRSLSLVYYPIWIVRYTYMGRGYFVTVDGITGQSISGRAPGDPLYQGLAIGLGGVGGGLLTGVSLMGLLLNPVAGALGLLIGIVLFGGGFAMFRYGSEIVEGDLEARYKKIPMLDVLKKLSRG